MMYLTLVEDGDIIIVDPDEPTGNVNATKYYIKRDGALVEVSWYEASEYQKPYQDAIREKRLGSIAGVTEVNPHLPLPPEDGKHIFGEDGRSYRCSRCAVYNRPDVPSTLEVLEKPCEGRWTQSGKMRAYAENRWQAEKEGRW